MIAAPGPAFGSAASTTRNVNGGTVSTAVARSAQALCPPSAVTRACVKSTPPARLARLLISMLGITVRLAPGPSVPSAQA